MESQSENAFYIKWHSLDRNKNKSSGGISKSRGRSKSVGKSLKKCYKCSKQGNYQNNGRSKSVERSKGSNDGPSI